VDSGDGLRKGGQFFYESIAEIILALLSGTLQVRSQNKIAIDDEGACAQRKSLRRRFRVQAPGQFKRNSYIRWLLGNQDSPKTAILSGFRYQESY